MCNIFTEGGHFKNKAYFDMKDRQVSIINLEIHEAKYLKFDDTLIDMLFTMVLRSSMIQIMIVISMLSHITYCYEMDEDNKCIAEFGPIYCNLLQQAYEVQQPKRIPMMQQFDQKRSLNKARNKLVKSSRFWGKRKDETFEEDKSALMPGVTNLDRLHRLSAHQKFTLPISSRFWG
uniref:Uncharacterized protein n=1 Tax=Elaeophora elaphi TaxID=1147741 RepID=A0A0R3S346_9BILA